jgi:uncharacterized membrane protein
VLSWLSLERHAAHLTNALDLGYYSNTLWNTIHGHLFRFSTYHAANFVFPEFDPNTVRKPDNLLAFHVEPILLPLSILYAFRPDPRALLIFQSVILASGAWPAWRIARRNLNGRLAMVFPIMYLLSPSLAGANLSDIHPVALSAALVLWTYDALERCSYRRYFAFVVLTLALKEEMGLLVAMLGAYATLKGVAGSGTLRNQLHTLRARVMRILVNPQVRAGLLTVTLAAIWTAGALLIQRDAGGHQISLFAARYDWLGHTPREMVVNALTTLAVPHWLAQPTVLSYLGFLLAQVGFLALLAPEILLIAAPELALNTLSNFDWMRSGYAHYSAPILPLFVIAAITGTARLARWITLAANRIAQTGSLKSATFFARRRLVSATLAMLCLLSALYQAARAGELPITQGFAPFVVSAHDRRLDALAALIPPGAIVSAQSDLYPHVRERANIYLFPTIADADYILLDVSGQTYPIRPAEYVATIKQLLHDTPAGIVAAQDGYLLLARNQGDKFALPDAFFSFARASMGQIGNRLNIPVGQSLQLLGYDMDVLPPRQVAAPSASIRTYWRVLRPLEEPLRFAYRFYAPDGSLSNVETDSPTERWLPATRWQTGNVYVVEQRGVQTPRGTKIGIRVERGAQSAPLVEQVGMSESQQIEDGVIRLLTVD